MNTTRRIRIRRLLLFLVLVGITAVCVCLLATRRPPLIEARLSDGSVLDFERISYEKWHLPEAGGAWDKVKEKARAIWLKWKFHSRANWVAGSGAFYSSRFAGHTNEPALQVWVSRTSPIPSTAPPVAVPTRAHVDALVLVGEDGSVYPSTQEGTAYEYRVANNIKDVTSTETRWFSFEAFPRHDQQLHLRVYESGTPWKIIAEVAVPNPAPRPKAVVDWAPEPLPARHPQGEVTFALNHLTIKTNFSRYQPYEPVFSHPLGIDPVLEVLDHAVPVTAPDALDLELFDSSGNFASKQFDNALYLSPKEKFWKLRVKYFGVVPPDSDSNSVWTIHNLAVPGTGKSSPVSLTNHLSGVKVAVIALVGAGTANYRNDVLLSTGPKTTGTPQVPTQTWFSGIGPPVTDYSFEAPETHVALTIAGMTHDQRVTVEAKDDAGRTYSGKPITSFGDVGGERYLFNPNDDRPVFIVFDASPAGKTVDLTIRVHHPVATDFVIKPPQP